MSSDQLIKYYTTKGLVAASSDKAALKNVQALGADIINVQCMEGKILFALCLLKHDTTQRKFGICKYVRENILRYFGVETSLQLLHHTWSGWSHYSGSNTYPVRIENAHDQSTEYMKTIFSGTVWDKSTKHGRLRFDLLDYLINVFSSKPNVLVRI